jgi:membrane-bound ClpP family serine protease
MEVGISDADKVGFMSVIHKLDRSKGLDLILHTPGGDMAATESLIEYINQMFKNEVRAIIPQIAMSGGTIMALACKEIVMGKGSSIGPIDPQFGGMAATGLLAEFDRIRDEIKKDPSSALLWEPMLRQIRPGFITECENAIDWGKQMAKRFLTSNMLVGKDDKETVAAQIVEKLTEKKNTKTHGRHIGFDEAKGIMGDGVRALEDDQALQDAVLTVHHATTITLDGTGCYKIIENHVGRAFIRLVKMTVVAQ